MNCSDLITISKLFPDDVQTCGTNDISPTPNLGKHLTASVLPLLNVSDQATRIHVGSAQSDFASVDLAALVVVSFSE